MALVAVESRGETTMGRNKVLGKLGRLTGHGNETTAVVGGTLSIRISTSARSASVSFLSLSLSLFSPCYHPFLRYLYLHDTCVAYDATRSFSRSSFFSRLSTPSFSPPSPFLLPLPNDHEHRYHDRISPSKFPLVRAGSQSNNHLRALHSYLTRRGSRFYTAPASPSISVLLRYSLQDCALLPPHLSFSLFALFPLHPSGHVGG